MNGEHDYTLERSLKKRDPDLHKRYIDTVFVLQKILQKYRLLFPEYTDHSELHCMTVIDFCNALVGEEQADLLTPDEIYVLLAAGYLHDTGMGITKEQYEEFRQKIDVGDYFDTHPDVATCDFVRDFHHEFSGHFIRKYGELLEIPSEEHLFGVIQVARGHRKTDLFDPQEYPADYRVPNGNRLCLPYLAALIRLADEIDVVASRNPILLYDIESLTDVVEIWEHRKVKAIQALITNTDSFTMVVQTDDEELFDAIVNMREKMQKTLDYCRNVTEERTPFHITQKTVNIERV